MSRIALVTPGYPPDAGGVELVVQRTARHLQNLGEDIEVWTMGREAVKTSSVRDGVLVRSFPTAGPREFRISPALAQHVRRHSVDFDIIHGHNYHSVAMVSAALASSEVPLVLTLHYHGGGHSRIARLAHRPYRPLAAAALARADALVAVSQAEAELAANEFADRDQFVVIPNGIDVEEIVRAAPFANEPLTMLLSGRHESYKRMDVAIRAFAEVSRPEQQLVVLGDGPDRSALERVADRSGSRGQIRFLGFVDEATLRRWQRTAAVFVNMSEHEAFGLSAVEAAAGGAHVFLSDIEAHREVVRTVGNAEVVTSDRALAQAIGGVFEGSITPAAGSTKALRSWRDVAVDHRSLYSDLLRRNASRSDSAT